MHGLRPISAAVAPLFSLLLAHINNQLVDVGDSDEWNKAYDYVIVGAGSAGSVLANRLSEDPNVRVLLLEAGGKENFLSELPFAAPGLQKSELDWAYHTVPQKSACRAMKDHKSFWPRGKVLGGCSTINFMLYVRGNKRDYDQWAQMGCVGWSWAQVFPYFLKSEDMTETGRNIDPNYHSTGGYQTVSVPSVHDTVADDFIRAGQELGYEVGDYNGPVQSVFSYTQGTVRDGLRCSTAKAFLYPVLTRPNLTIVTYAQATRVLFEPNSNVASGVEFIHSDRLHKVRARREVILSAGSVNTAQLLMLSGVGPAKHLRKFKIPLVADLPVGNNLQDHIYTGVYFKTTPQLVPQVTPTPDAGQEQQTDQFTEEEHPQSDGVNITEGAVRQFIKDRIGPILSLGGVQAFGFVKTNFTDPSDDWPDFQLHLVPQLASSGTMLLKSQLGLLDKYVDKFLAPYERSDTAVVFPVMLRPKSRGTIRLRSSDPLDSPLIDPRYYSHPDDLQMMVEAMKIAIALTKSTPLQHNHKAELFTSKPPNCERYKLYSDQFLACFAQSFTATLYHPVGTCRMGPIDDRRTVVDPQLRVKGVRRLRVADASIMPNIVSGNTNAPVIMIGERAADLIKAATE